MRLRLITNPRASGVSEEIVSAAVARLTAVSHVDLAYTTRPGHAIELAAEFDGDAVVALGGDGTTNEVVNGLRPETRFGALPGGASSVYARQLGFPEDPFEAAGVLAAAVAHDHTRSVGLGAVDGRRFTFAASIGFDAAATRAIDDARHRRDDNLRPGDLQVLREALRQLGSNGYRFELQMSIASDDREPIRGSYIAVANQHPYTYFGKLPVNATPRAGFETALDAVVLGEIGATSLPRLALYALVWPRHAEAGVAGVTYLHDSRTLAVTCDTPLPVQIDGEYVGEREHVEITYLDAAARVFVPMG